MKNQDARLIKRITREYVAFMKQSSVIIEDVKRATVLALKAALELNDGDQILIKEDGGLEVFKSGEERHGNARK